MQNRLLSRFGLCFVLVLLIVHNAHAQQFPMQVYAAEEGAALRGGPGDAYYATIELRPGDELTAYRLDGDWYAVRPPRGSFSLVSANAIADRGDGTGEVIRQGAASRIGSSIVDMQDTVHVRLEKGEPVRILGSQIREGVKWLRIEPPHGEFRWVHRGDVSMTPIERMSIPPVDPRTAATVLPLTHNGGDRYAAPPLAGENDPTWEAAKPLPPSATGSASALPAQVNPVQQQPESTGRASGTPPLEPLKPSGEQNSVAQSAPATDEDFARQMFVMEVELGRIVSDSPERWNLGGMEQEARRLLTQAKTEEQRQSAQALAGRLERFTAIRRQYELLPPVDTAIAARTRSRFSADGRIAHPTTVAQSVSDASGNSNGDPRFDAMGMLRPVASKRANAPKYALVNEAGQIITFVTPAPDVNLQPYLGRLVGVSGTRGYMAEYNHRHVTAGRVMPMNDRIVR